MDKLQEAISPSSLCSTPTPSNTELTTLPSTADPTHPQKRSWVWVYFSDIDEKYIQCQFVDLFGKTCNQHLKKDQTGSTKGMSQHLHLLHCIANPKSISSPLAKHNMMDQTSPNITAYLAVTSHYIDTDFKLTSIIIGLAEIKGDHSGESLATQFLKIIRHYDLEQKIICITTDNASVNNQMAQDIEATFPKFCAKDNMVGCMAHTIHLAACDGLKSLGRKPPDPNNNSVDNNNENPMSITSLVDPPDGLNLQ
ncbi:hypothetical protein O181_026760 [Austropuccinia psidii MF-1]|uniref:DUF659 domain-containing protein n=1 Tax=Austropuccinia psidii MF-1 TaxID=1389203 RepID=A0A9Q3H2H8_9BASI|nr:hypothetical protein [Austropuccinia psidii MF-1]